MNQALRAHLPSPDLHLGIPGFRFADLHDTARLADLTREFDDFLRAADVALFARYCAHRGGSARLRGPEESELLLDLGATSRTSSLGSSAWSGSPGSCARPPAGTRRSSA